MHLHWLNRSPPLPPFSLRIALTIVLCLGWGKLTSANEASPRDPSVAHERVAQERARAADSSVARERRVLGEIIQTNEPGSALARLAGPIPANFTSRLEKSLDPQLLQRFGGPGLDVEDLHEAMNGALRAGARPHLNMVLGLFAVGGYKQLQKLDVLEKVRAPKATSPVKLGIGGGGLGVMGSAPKGWPRVDGGIYVLPPRSATAPGHRVHAVLRGLGFKGFRPRFLAAGRLEAEHVVNPGGAAPSILTHAARVVVPLPAYRAARFDLAAGMSVTSVGPQMTRIHVFRPSMRLHQLVLDFDFQHVDLGPVSYLDGGLRGSLVPLRVEARVRQDPWRHHRPIVEARVYATDLMPRLGW